MLKKVYFYTLNYLTVKSINVKKAVAFTGFLIFFFLFLFLIKTTVYKKVKKNKVYNNLVI